MQRKQNSRIYEHGTSNEEKQNKKDNDDLIDDVCQFTGSTSDAVRKSVEMAVNDPLSLMDDDIHYGVWRRRPRNSEAASRHGRASPQDPCEAARNLRHPCAARPCPRRAEPLSGFLSPRGAADVVV